MTAQWSSVVRSVRVWRSLIVLVALAAFRPPLLSAQAVTDVKGGKDHPLVSRYEGSVMLGYRFHEFDELAIPLGPVDLAGREWKAAKELRVEGQATRLIYMAPAGRTSLEVLRNYEQELTRAGFQVLYRCAAQQCRALENHLYPPGGRLTYGNGIGRDYAETAFASVIQDPRYVALKRTGSDGEAYVSLFVGVNDLPMVAQTHMRTLALLDVVVKAGMDTGMVKVDAATMAREMSQSGHVALYGILFDSNKAVLKPESEPALVEIATLLKQNPKLNLYVVGHTDNVGSLESNMGLSDRRAASVVQALTGKHGIAATRLRAAGVGPVAPVASNATEAGRAKNRRVELVGQ